MRLSCLFLELRVSLSLDTVPLCDSDGSYVLLRGRTLLYGGEDIFLKIPVLMQAWPISKTPEDNFIHQSWTPLINFLFP